MWVRLSAQHTEYQTCLPPQNEMCSTACDMLYVLPISPLDPAALPPLTDSTWCEEQSPLRNSGMNAPPLADPPQTASLSQMYQPSPSELPFGQEDVHPTLFGLLTIDPSLPSNPLSSHPPAADPGLGVCWACMCVMLQT